MLLLRLFALVEFRERWLRSALSRLSRTGRGSRRFGGGRRKEFDVENCHWISWFFVFALILCKRAARTKSSQELSESSGLPVHNCRVVGEVAAGHCREAVERCCQCREGRSNIGLGSGSGAVQIDCLGKPSAAACLSKAAAKVAVCAASTPSVQNRFHYRT